MKIRSNQEEKKRAYPNNLFVTFSTHVRVVLFVAVRAIPFTLFLYKAAVLQRFSTIRRRTHKFVRMPIFALSRQVRTSENCRQLLAQMLSA